MTWGTQQNQVGKRVYRASSYAPNRGAVNPEGYIQRELQKRGVSKIGTDGQSDTRSGMASNALSRMGIGQGSQRNPKSPIQRPNYGLLGAKTAQQAQGQSMQQAPAQQGQGQQVQGQQPVAPLPVINVSPVGNLELPWDEATNYDAILQKQDMDQSLREMKLHREQQQAEWVRSVQLANEQYEKQKVNRLNDSAGRGTAFSSQYGTGVNEDSYGYNNVLNDLNTGNNNNINSYNLGVTGIKNQWNTVLQQLAHQKSLKAAENAAAMAAAQQASVSQGVPGGQMIDNGGNVGQLRGGPGGNRPPSHYGWVGNPYGGGGNGNGNGPNKDGGKNKKGKN